MEHRVASVAELDVACLKRCEVAGNTICLAHTEDDEWYAIADTCSHEEYSLSEGDLWGRDIECAKHGSRFDLATGKPDQLPAVEPVRTYPVAVRDGDVFVDVEMS